MTVQINWVPPGPVALRFSEAPDFVSAIMGPVGSGKTTAALMKIINVAKIQRPSPIDGVRRCKALVIRDTFTNLKRTILPTWHGWFPQTMGEWVGGPPAQHRLRFDYPLHNRPGVGPIELIVDFMGLGEDSIENLLRSYEMTCFYGNEFDLMSFDALSFLMTRVGRYPSKLHGGPTWYGGWIDFNAPEQDHWLHQVFVEGELPGGDGEKAEGFKLFVQPGGLLPNAENVKNLVPGYYTKMARSLRPDLKRRMVDNLWGYSRDGKPVLPEYNDQIHCAPARLEPIKNIPVGIGIDGGGSPAAAFGQWLPGNRWRVLAEISSEPNTGPTRFAEMVLQVLADRFPGFSVSDDVYGWSDPSNEYGGDEEHGDPHWLAKVNRLTGIRFRPTATNNPHMRQEAVRGPLTRLVEGQPAFELCPSCKMIRKGLNSGYHFRRIKVGGASGRFDVKPEKNIYSHVCESLEYLLLGGGHGMAGAMGRERETRGAMTMAESDYDIFGDAA